MRSLAQPSTRALGAALWFAAVEIVLVARQQFTLGNELSRTPDPSYEVVVALFYACAGGLLGGLLALLLPTRFVRGAALRGLVALLLLAVIDAAAWSVAPWRRDFVTHGLVALLGLLALASLAGRELGRWRSLLHPLPITLLVLAPSIVTAWRPELDGGALLLPLSIWIAAVVGASVGVAPLRWPSWAEAAAPVFAVALATLVVSASHPPIADQRARSGASPPGALNVLFVTLDTVRADHTSVGGYARDTTPNLVELAEDGIVFERTYAAADLTLPSHASLFTGVPPRTHGARAGSRGESSWTRGLADRFQTLAERFASHGFSTYAVVANSRVINERLGLAQGFAYLDSRRGPTANGGADARLPRHHLGPILERLGLRERIYRDAAEIRRSTLRALDSASRSQPFFLFVNWMDAHFPYTPPEPYASLFPGRDPNSSLHRDPDAHERVQRQVLTDRGELEPSDRDHLVSQYDGGIAYLDAELGAVFERLRELGLFDRTIVYVTSDHGEAFGEHGALGHGVGSVYEELIHVPAILRVPGLTSGTREDTPVRASAIAAVLPELATAAAPSREALITHIDRENVVSEAYPEPWQMDEFADFQQPRRAIVSGRSKLIEIDDRTSELYDLEADPLERAAMPRETGPGAELVAALSSWLESNPEGEPAFAAIDAQTVEALHSLGYTLEADVAAEAARP